MSKALSGFDPVAPTPPPAANQNGPTMHDMHEATEILLQTAREYGSSNATGGDVVAAAYRLVATKVRERGYADLARDLERLATQSEKAA